MTVMFYEYLWDILHQTPYNSIRVHCNSPQDEYHETKQKKH